MLKILGTVLGLSLFAALILIGSQFVKWNGRTISDQVKLQISHTEYLKAKPNSKRRTVSTATPSTPSADGTDQIPASERQKLQALIRELNSSR